MTRDARFQANLRLERRQRDSNWMISILSLFVIFLSLVPNFTELTIRQTQILLALSVVNSIFIIITSLLEASGGFQLKGDALHRSARKIASVYNELMLLDAQEQADSEKIKDLQKDYQAALDDCSFNHENIDHYGAIASKPSLSSRFQKIWMFPMVSAIRYFIWERTWMTLHITVILISAVVIWKFIFGMPACSAEQCIQDCQLEACGVS
ncbi:SLATT domain-containing protein [Aliiroseovarius crassostreae]|uniref:SLATT domain-containing protein n=1 Tax=Aliiroseovarius crassostreae TaxID=154981 RepID=UPI0021FFC7EE|nr:SLATT domain-containing protein [Aliiroseovarius crassostreae]UWQ04227.1 SLATT domain-containing protein [Aliiroseovarius crassostreae]